jgi:hypothetical protein
MKGLTFAFGLLLSWGYCVLADEPIRFSHSSGWNPLPPNRDIFWSEPPNLEGLIGSSEQILEFGLETELANDFLTDRDLTITLARWWGGYYNYTPGDPLVTSFNLRFYENADCLPGPLYYEVVVFSNAHESFIYDQGAYPIYEYRLSLVLEVTQGHNYWFLAQAGDHPFPPQWGRLQSVESIGCEAAFRSEFFSYPDWAVPCGDLPPIYPCDFSQEFEEESEPTPVIPSSWGKIKGLSR